MIRACGSDLCRRVTRAGLKQSESQMNDTEVERIRQIYENYSKHGKWNRPNPGWDCMISEGRRELHRIFNRERHSSLSEARILDIGCGSGFLLGRFSELGAQAENLFGVDIVPDRMMAARSKFPAFSFEVANAENLDFPEGSFDLISVFTVFSSVLDDSTSNNIAKTMTRLLKPDGAVLWYDLRYPNPKNRNVRAMTKTRIRRLFPDFSLNLKSITLLPR